jgi:tetratricopeptide (TPR) repeat protein
MQRIFSIAVLVCGMLLTNALYAQENNEAKKLYNQGNAKLKSGDFAGAVQHYDQALAVEKHQFYFYQRGIALRKSGKEPQAIESFKAAVELAPKFDPGFNALGSGYFALKKYDLAIEHYQKALKIKPSLAPAKKGLAAALTANANKLSNDGDLEGAIAQATQAISTEPNYSTAYIILAKSYNKSAKYKQAISAGENALKKMRGSKGAAHFEIGLAHRNLGNTAAAKKAFKMAKKDPTYSRNAEYELKQLQ